MTLQQLQEEINHLDIMGARVMEITSRHFTDELYIRLSYNPANTYNSLSFTGCTKINLQHRQGYQKLFSVKEYFLSKIPCHIQKIQPAFAQNNGVALIQFVLDLHPLEVLVVCRELTVKNRTGEILFSVAEDTSGQKRADFSITDIRASVG